MKLKIIYKPHFRVVVTKRLFTALFVCSEHHYDANCRSASKVGGILWGVKNSFEWAETEPDTVAWTWNWREMDLLLKLTEGVPGLLAARLLTAEDAKEVHDFIELFRGARDLANQRDDLETVVELCSAPPASREPTPAFEYFYSRKGCAAEHPTQPGCHCWHAEGTGLYPKARHDSDHFMDGAKLQWRNAATKVWL